MNNKLRQEILKEIKFLLNEQEEAEQGVFGGTFSEDLDDIIEDINDANIKKIAGFDYIDLTTMEDSTDEGELSLFVKSFKSVNKPEQLQDPKAKKAIENVCSKNVLLINSVGITDTYFYVSCKQISGGLSVPVSAKKLGIEGQEATFPEIIDQIKKGGSPTTGGETGNFCADPKNEGKSVPDMFNFVCKNGQAVSTAPSPTPVPTPVPQGQIGAQGKNSFKCPNQEDVAVLQQWLGVKEDCSVGVNTLKAAQTKGLKLNLQDYFSAGELSPEQKQKQIEFCNSLKTNRAGYEAEIKKSGQEVKGKCPVAGSGGGKSKGSPTTKNKVMFNEMSENTKQLVNKYHPSIGAVDFAYKSGGKWVLNIPNGAGADDDQGALVTQKELYDSIQEDANKGVPTLNQRLEESYYDKKKLVEAKQLFSKLLKKL